MITDTVLGPTWMTPGHFPQTGTLEARVRREAFADDRSELGKDTLSKVPGYAQRYFKAGNLVEPLFDSSVTPKNGDDDIFAQIEKMIRGAEKNIQIEMFSLDKKDLVDLICKTAKSGVKVQIVMDPPNEEREDDKAAAIEKLRKAGCDVLLYPTREVGDPEAKFGQLNHVKMLLVDGKRAIIGGMNWGDHSPNNHDYDVQVEGPAVEQMSWLFREDWIKSGGDSKELPYIQKQPAHPDGGAMVQLLTAAVDDDKLIGKTIRRAIDNARKSVHAELFVLTDRPTIAALKKAHARGVDVKIILNPLKIKGNEVNERAFAELKKAGVPIKWYVPNEATQENLHAKMAVFDDDQVIVGSANWSYAGFNTNREANVEVLSTKLADSFDTVFEKDWKNKTSDEPIYMDEPDNG